jgi:hypothetical protein
MPESVTELPRNSDGSINAPVSIKDPDGNVIGRVLIPFFPDGTTNRIGVAKYFGYSTRTIDEWIAGGKVPYERRSPRSLRFRLERVAKALAALSVRGIR